MSSPSPFVTVFLNEVLYNSKRVAPYAVAALFSGNAVLWWGWGPAMHYGWATNSDYFLSSMFVIFSFMTLPLFTALLMGEPVVRDFRFRIDPLVFSKPVGRASYLLGKFFGNFFVLACCQAAFVLTLFVLQAVNFEGMVVLSPRAFPYLRHFLFLTLVSNLPLAVLYFTVGTLTRSVKLVYAAAVSFYLLYITWQVAVLKGMPQRWRVLLDPLVMNWTSVISRETNPDLINQLPINYDSDVIVNRALMLLISAACLTVLYFRFSKVESHKSDADAGRLVTLGLSAETERLAAGAESFGPGPVLAGEGRGLEAGDGPRAEVSIPEVRASSGGIRAGLGQFAAATGVEFRLLGAERGLVVVLPLAALLCGLQLAYIQPAPDAASFAGLYASEAVNAVLIFLFGVTVFYTGEALNRDRELRVEPVLWCAPAPDYVFLLSKFAAVFLLSLSLVALVALTAVTVQIFKGHTPVGIRTHLCIYAVILLPGVAFMAAVAVASNAVLRDKYLAYALSIAAGVALYYLLTQGYNNWLYNPVLHQLWKPEDFAGGGGGRLARILVQRIYFLALAAFCLSLSHLCFARKPSAGVGARGRLGGAKLTIVLLIVSAALAVFTGLTVAKWG